MRHSRAVVTARRTPMRVPPSPRRPAVEPTPRRPTITLTLRRRVIPRALRQPAIAILSHALFGLKLLACALAAGMVALAIMNYQDPETAVPGYEPGGNETIVYRRVAPPPARLQGSEAADQGDESGSYYPRAVQTVRF